MSLLLENFASVLTTVEAIERLEARILQWAVQGKLVPQDTRDESSNLLLEEIRTTKRQLVKDGVIKGNEMLPPIRKDEIPFETPKGWTWARLGELVCKLGAGSTPTGGSKVYQDQGIKFIRSQNVWNNGLHIQDIAYISEETNNRMKGSIVEAKDILLNITGASIARSALVPEDFDIGNVNQHVVIIRLIDLAIRHFVHLHLISPLTYRHIMDVQVGVSREGLSVSRLRNFVIPIPPLAEQQRIVEKVESLLVQTRAIKEQLILAQEKNRQLNKATLHHLLAAGTVEEFQKRWGFIRDNFETLYHTPENVRELKQAILQLAVRGKLVKQNPRDEPARVLVERIREEKEVLGKKTNALPPIREEEKPYELPKGWEWVRVGQIASAIDYGTSQKADDTGKVPMLRMGNIVNGEIIYKILKYLPEEISDLPRLYLQNNDLLFNRTNSYELVGKTGVFREKSNKYTFASYLIRISFVEDLTCSEYINIYFNTKVCRETQIEPQITQQTGQANFNGTKLKNILLPFPPLREQQRIIEKTKLVLDLCDLLESGLVEKQKAHEKMVSAILAEA